MYLISEFAARWRQRFTPHQVKAGRELAREGIVSGSFLPYNQRTLDNWNPEQMPKETKQKIFKLQETNKIYKKHLSIDKYGIYKDPLVQNQLDVESRLRNEMTPAKRQRLEELRKKYPNNRQQIVTPKSNSSNILKSKKLPLGKIGIGLATVGAIGSGIALNRKSRNDKGKKRRFYRK